MADENEPSNVVKIIASTDELYKRFGEIADLDLVEQAAALEAIAVKGMTTAKIKSEFNKYQNGFAKMLAEQARDAQLVEDLKLWMLESFVQVTLNGTLRVGYINREPDEEGELPHNFMTLMTYRDFRDAFANLPNLAEDMSACNWWQRNPDRKNAYGSIFRPDKPGGAVVGSRVNLWWGMGVKPTPAGPGQYADDVRMFLGHLWSLCGGPKSREFGYLLRWLAWGVQNPTKPIGTAVVLTSEPGTGKGLLFSTMTGIYGVHGRRFHRRDEIVGRFNYLLEGCAFAALEEATWAGSKSDAERMKSMITDPAFIVEKKYFSSESIVNITKFISATNADWAVHVDPNDRRMAVIACPEPTLSHADFAAIVAKLEGPERDAYLGAVLTFLLSIDLTGWSAERNRPVNSAYTDQKLSSLTGDLLWWRLVLERGGWSVDGSLLMDPKLAAPPNWFSKSSVHGLYCDWHFRTKQYGAPAHASVFWRNVAKWFPEGDFEGPRPRDEDDNRLRTIRLPADLSKLHEPFSAWLGRAHKTD